MLTETGAADLLARSISSALGSADDMVLLISMFIACGLLANVISPAAVAALMFPIMYSLPSSDNNPDKGYNTHDLLGKLSAFT